MTLPYPPYGTLNYFDQTASAVLDRIYNYRNTAILPQQTGPVVDVLYSAAGNSADEAYYSHGIIGYDFEIGASKVLATGHPQGTGFQPCYGAVGTGGGTGTCNANLVNEGHDEGMEFANGNYALLASALQYAKDTTPPVVNADRASPTARRTYTSSSPATRRRRSTTRPTARRRPPPRPSGSRTARASCRTPLDLAPGKTLKWIATDFKGNTSAVKSQVLGQTDTPGTVGGSVPATLALTMGAPAQFGAFAPGVAKDTRRARPPRSSRPPVTPRSASPTPAPITPAT